MALANPSAWAYCRPVVEENNGWAIFITTPRGRNHAYEMFKHASKAPTWFCEMLTAEDTVALTREQLDEALAEYVALYGIDAGTAQYRQEYLCDWAAALLGSIFAREMAEVRAEGRVCEIGPLPGVPVNRSWDLGMRDDTCVWFFQVAGTQIYLLHCISTSGASLEWWRDEVVRVHKLHGWKHGVDYVPHDAKVRELGTGRTRVETMKSLGLRADPGARRRAARRHQRGAPDTAVLCISPALRGGRRYRAGAVPARVGRRQKCFRQSPLHD